MYKRNSNTGGMSQKKKTARSISMPCPAEQNLIKESMDLVINGTLELDLIDEKTENTENSDRDSISTTNEQTSSDFWAKLSVWVYFIIDNTGFQTILVNYVQTKKWQTDRYSTLPLFCVFENVSGFIYFRKETMNYSECILNSSNHFCSKF